MHIENLKPLKVKLENLYLDPNNPRFWTDETARLISDKKTTSDTIQSSTYDKIKKEGVEELFYSILRNGFLPMDRIVVRKLAGESNSYVVLEGNRRLAALRMLHERIDQHLIDEDDADEDYLDKLKKQTANIEALVYEGDEGSDISWLLQGIRHISGIRDWQPAQRAKLVADQIDEEGMSLREAGQMFGLSAIAVGRLYRAFKGLQQMKKDEEYSSKADNSFFSLFEEVYRNTSTRKWLNWDDSASEFKNTNNLKQFYSWISKDDDHDGDRRIHDPRHIKMLGIIIDSGKLSLLNKIDDYEITIHSAKEIAEGEEFHNVDWEDIHEKINRLLKEIPSVAYEEHPRKYLKSVEKLLKQLEKQKKLAESQL